MRYLLICFLLLLPSSLYANAIDDLAPGEWLEIPNSKLADSGEVPDPRPPGAIGEGLLRLWTGGVMDTKRHRLIVGGGGHNNYAGTEWYAFDLDDLTWERITDPYGYEEDPQYTTENAQMTAKTQVTNIPGWTEESSWTEASDKVWYMDVTGITIARAFVRYPTTYIDTMKSLLLVDSIAEVDAFKEYFVDSGTDRLYIYSYDTDGNSINPALFFTDMETSESPWCRLLYYPNDAPVSKHTYGTPAYDEANDYLWQTGIDTMWAASGEIDNTNLYYLDLDFERNPNKEYVRIPDLDVPGKNGSLTLYDPTSEDIYIIGSSNTRGCVDIGGNQGTECNFLSLWDISSGVENATTTRLVNGDVKTGSGCVDTTRNRLLMIGPLNAKGVIKSYDLDDIGPYTSITSLGDTEWFEDYEKYNIWQNASAPGVRYDPVQDRVILWQGGPMIWSGAWNAEETSITWTRMEGLNQDEIPIQAEGMQPVNGTYTKFQYSPHYDVFVIVTGASENVFVYRYGTGTITPHVSGTDTDALVTPVPDSGTMNSTTVGISIEWVYDMTLVPESNQYLNDIDHDAVASVAYKKVGDTEWIDSMPLMRIHTNNSRYESDIAYEFDMMSGSIFGLEPGTTYDVRLSYVDPDGGSRVETLQQATLALPSEPVGGRTLHISPPSFGPSGETGTEEDPFLSFEAADDQAVAGDIFLVHGGDYRGITGGAPTLSADGTVTNRIVYKAAGDGEALFDRLTIVGDYMWFRGLTLEAVDPFPDNDTTLFQFSGSGGAVTECSFTYDPGTRTKFYFIYGTSTAADWYIADNTFVGSHEDGVNLEDYGGEAIDMQVQTRWSGHTIAHNSITQVGDGVSYMGGNSDTYGNDIFLVSDDGIEPDYAASNVRVWKNRIMFAYNNALSLQDFQNGGPWYFIRNQVMSFRESVLKGNSPGQNFAFYHNTVVNWDHISQDNNMREVAYGTVKNNLFITKTSTTATNVFTWRFLDPSDFRTAYDYNGYDLGGNVEPFEYLGKDMTFTEWQTEFGGPDVNGAPINEANSIEVEESAILNPYIYTGPIPTQFPHDQYIDLAPGDNAAVDAGVFITGLNDETSVFGASIGLPDLGAYERGALLPVYGPRGLYKEGTPIWGSEGKPWQFQ